TPRVCGWALLLSLAACDPGCATSQKLRPLAKSLRALQGVDCPDGLARCEAGSVSVSRLTTLPGTCAGTPQGCACPWDVAGECLNGCVLEGLELVVEPPRATAQLCAPPAGAPSPAVPWAGSVLPPTPCDEGDAYRCAGGAVLDCRSATPVGSCVGGCYRDGASIADTTLALTRERAFALLCSR
ncbi:MAG: hypothetical protein ACRENE_25205, partial [Polyangiaceae bacterium]